MLLPIRPAHSSGWGGRWIGLIALVVWQALFIAPLHRTAAFRK
jgi:hypothetical protein